MLADFHHGGQLLQRLILGDVIHPGSLGRVLQNVQDFLNGFLHAVHHLAVGLEFRVKHRIDFHGFHSFANSANNSLQAG